MQQLPSNIRVGMKVYDSSHHEIGTVDDLKFPENAIDPSVEPAAVDAADRPDRRDTILTSIAEAFGEENVPEELQSRLLREGYVRLDTAGLFARDRFILPEQIASASGDEIVLNVDKHELIKH